ncbi:FGGY-family carbohydrate kinase [Chelativorans sp. AA-79]|uniref:FGGY-family carbohydrate kinase n=1 Tax=Chelativorans sp. AA-79 TaxID=3028735 RepID=UPI0023F9E399|nr:FGGY-family carbohydrate kinase [Chelativorans sp. AA-79]WEX08370.1 FGGY-family carbohydrate kinase [Chelativorans sp. AA-79]
MIPKPPRALGIDVGSSGVRIAALDEDGRTCALAAERYRNAAQRDDPAAWWRGVEACLEDLTRKVSLQDIAAVAVDGTSGTVLALDGAGAPLGRALMYDVACPDPHVTALLEAIAPAESPARGKHSALARAAFLARQPAVARVVHQADWIAMQLGGGPVSDENNALKTGYDLTARRWPDWIAKLGLDPAILPEVVPAGTVLCPVGEKARTFGLPASAVIVSGTTDGCASFLATGAGDVGDGVTALGSTLVLKLLSDREINAPAYGIYSHRIAGMWLAGGASNTGGAVIRAYFPDDRLAELTERLNPDRPTGLDYYPLLRPGERFPVNDPALAPRLDPRPSDDAVFFQGLLEGIAAVEAQGYARLSELGAPALRAVRSVGGGAANAAWMRIRQRRLGVPFLQAASTEAAAGTARLALRALS